MSSLSNPVFQKATESQPAFYDGAAVIAQPVTTPADDSVIYLAAKRAFDLTISLAAMVIAVPIMLVLAVLIRLDSPGPALFRQLRVGKNGRLFTFYKFRTMWVDAKQRFPELYAYKYTDEEIRTMYFKMPEDPRLTRVGRYLRKTSLDELPNFISVLRGDMSLVGPRPEIPEMLPYYTEEQLVKFAVTPGVTGLAQTSGRAILSFQDTIKYDMEYCKQRSFWFDLQIWLRTVKCIVLGIGAF